MFTDLRIRKTKSNKYGYARIAWVKLLRKFDPTTGDSKTILHKKFARWKLDHVTRDPEYWITEL